MTSNPTGSSSDRRKEIEGHLQMIEAQYPLRIRNKKYIIEKIIEKTSDSQLILTIAFSLNHWVAVNGITGEVTIPERVIDQILRLVH